MTTTQLDTSLNSMLSLLGEGKFLEAMDEFLADDVVLQEGLEEPKVGKAHCMALEAKVLEDVAVFGGYTVSSIGIGENATFYQAIMDYTLKDGTRVIVDQCVADKWRDGKIVSQRFYQA